VQTGHRYREGRRYLLVSGQLRNTTSETRDVDLWVNGYYDRTGERVASPLATDTQQGYRHLTIPGDTNLEFEMELNWSSRLSCLRVQVAGEDTPVPPFYAEGQVLDFLIEPEPGTFLAEGIVLEESSARLGTLDVPSYNVQNRDHCSEGDWCVLVSGRIRNTTCKTRDVDIWVDGYDLEGERVASTLASETQEGYLHLDMAGEADASFEISVSWSDEIHRMEIAADIDDRKIPSPPVSPSSSMPAGLTVEPSAGGYLPDGRDEPSDLLLLTVEAEQIESPEEYWYMTPEDRHVVPQGDPIVVVRGAIQNRHRAYRELTMNAYGFDAAGEQVSWTLDSGHLPGCIDLRIEPGQVGEFTLHMNRADGLKSIHIHGGAYPIPLP
jgi:hypothetical protein